MRNHHNSPFSDDVMTYESMCLDIYETMNFLQIDKANFIAHSMGGKAIMAMSLLFPERINKSMIVDIAPADYTKDPRWQPIKLVTALQSISLPDCKNRDEINQQLKRLIPDNRLRLFLLTNLYYNEMKKQYSWKVNLPTIQKSIFELGGFPSIFQEKGLRSDTNTIFVAGGDSYYILDEEYRKSIDRYFSNYSIEIVPNAGHWVHADETKKFSELIWKHML